MGRRGPAPKPIEQRIAEGTAGKKGRASVPLIIGDRNPPEPAAYLTPAQKREFRRLVEELRDSKLLDSADRGMIELAAIEVDVVIRCNRQLQRALTVRRVVTHGGSTGKNRYVSREVSPYLKMREDAVNKLRYLYRELGIGAASRASLANGGATGKKPDQVLPGVGDKPTPLRVVNGGKGE